MQLPAILLPGILTPADITFRYLTRAFDGSVDLVLRDLAIYADGAPPPDYAIDREIDALLAFADENGFDRFHLGGFSGGGAISASFAARHPDRLASLALMEPAWFGNEDETDDERALRDAIKDTEDLPYEESLAAFARLNVAEGVEIPPPPQGDPPAWMEHRPAGIFAIAPAFRAHHLDYDALRELDCPVLFMRGGLSNPVMYQRIEQRAATIFRDFTVELFPERHHFDPPHRSEPERAAKLLVDFWQRAEG